MKNLARTAETKSQWITCYSTSALLAMHSAVISTADLSVRPSRVWWTDRRTDGETEFSSLHRVCIPCSAVKSVHLAPLSLMHSSV